MSDDLVKRLRATCSCNIDNTPCLAEEECRVAQEAADRIEALEAKLVVQDYDVHPVEMAARIKELDEQLENMCNLWAKAETGRQVLLGRIEELEAKLRKCVGALGDISDGEPEWPDDPQKELDWCRNRAKRTIAELKGQDDE